MFGINMKKLNEILFYNFNDFSHLHKNSYVETPQTIQYDEIYNENERKKYLGQFYNGNIAIDRKEERQLFINRLFKDIVGYEDKKKIITMGIMSAKPLHFLLVGDKGTGKTMFMDCLYNYYQENSLYLSGDGLTSSSLKQRLYETQPRFLFIDEIDKGEITIQEALLGLTENGTLRKSTRKESFDIKLNCWVMATANNKDCLNEYLADRFIIIKFDSYTSEQFLKIAPMTIERNVPNISTAMINSIIDKMLQRNLTSLRKAVRIALMVHDMDDIELILDNSSIIDT